uniref:Uncharacterized protein n=1 Tax=viral metagenome TaxID=1070528 RepID=A0A6M3KYR3_9ZZZZ
MKYIEINKARLGEIMLLPSLLGVIYDEIVEVKVCQQFPLVGYVANYVDWDGTINVREVDSGDVKICRNQTEAEMRAAYNTLPDDTCFLQSSSAKKSVMRYIAAASAYYAEFDC